MTLNSSSPCLNGLKHYFRYDSYIKNDLCNLFQKVYSIDNIFTNDLLALKSRIDFIQRTEPCSA